jgi:hypothetical protein
MEGEQIEQQIEDLINIFKIIIKYERTKGSINE